MAAVSVFVHPNPRHHQNDQGRIYTVRGGAFQTLTITATLRDGDTWAEKEPAIYAMIQHAHNLTLEELEEVLGEANYDDRLRQLI